MGLMLFVDIANKYSFEQLPSFLKLMAAEGALERPVLLIGMFSLRPIQPNDTILAIYLLSPQRDVFSH